MNERGYFDFKRPIGSHNDYRTSTYRGHLILPNEDSRFINHDFSKDYTQFLQSIGDDEERCITESQDQFSWKILKPSVVEKPLSSNGVDFMKSYDETHFHNNPKQITHLSSVSQRDYQWKSKSFQGQTPPPIYITSETKANKNISIDRCRSGFGKLLDPSATTNTLTYRAYSKEESGTPSKGIITFWNWKNTFEKKHPFCNIAKKCSKPQAEFRTTAKHAPNNGLISEARSNYKQHLNFTNFDSSHINTKFISCSGEPNDKMKGFQKTRFMDREYAFKII
ncbi:uncharacterized protein LOC129950816 [Eupeodes corollae]|uniref:uncharacterized protein LOC129950816 n=1 Tax=Eupeodes corollae TaxID=290404 RepID=UPI0024923A19|nr:uncharacterized protein LOC129950816 [Eupeodes corollae]